MVGVSLGTSFGSHVPVLCWSHSSPAGHHEHLLCGSLLASLHLRLQVPSREGGALGGLVRWEDTGWATAGVDRCRALLSFLPLSHLSSQKPSLFHQAPSAHQW